MQPLDLHAVLLAGKAGLWLLALNAWLLAACMLLHTEQSLEMCALVKDGLGAGVICNVVAGRQLSMHSCKALAAWDERCELWAAVHALDARWPHALGQRLTALSASACKPVEAVEAQHVSQPRLLCMLAHVLLDLIHAWQLCQAQTPSILAFTQNPYLWAEEP